ncbi:hypothetical protein [Pseudoalteromonas sp. C12FD-1]|uniref:hypothetical protein n=1 Tax=Pseudoalteromonas sp. C12FD-1 TaxID=3131979 RepID=UPI00307E9AE8
MTDNNLNPFYLNADKEITANLNALLSRQQIESLTAYGISSPEHFIALLCHRELDMTISNLLGVNREGFNILLDVLGMLFQQSDENIEEPISTGFMPQGEML